jgi:hypothetical protein
VPDTHNWLTYVYAEESPLRASVGAAAAKGR